MLPDECKGALSIRQISSVLMFKEIRRNKSEREKAGRP